MQFPQKTSLFFLRRKRGLCLFASCLFFFSLYGWLFIQATTIPLPSSQTPILFYSNQARHDMKLLFCSAFKKAKESIHISVYGLTDKEVIQHLKKRSLEGIHTVITYDKRASSYSVSDLRSSTTLYAQGGSGLMHKKIVVIDDCLVFLGSANLTTTSLKHHDNLVIGLYSKALASYLIASQKPPTKKRKIKNPQPHPSFSFQMENSQGELCLLPDAVHETEKKVIEVIHRAKTSIKIAMFTLTHPAITQALIEAHHHGIHVHVILDYYTARGASEKRSLEMQEAGIDVRMSLGQELFHYKWALIDETLLLMGSANWTKAAFEKNEDFILFLPSLSQKHSRFMQTLWKKVYAESFVINPL